MTQPRDWKWMAEQRAQAGRQLTDSVEVLYVHATIKLKVVQRVSRETEAVRGEKGTECF